MKKTKLLLIAALCLSLLAALLVTTACQGGGSNAVAATVNGVEIMEQDITDTIESMRDNAGDYSDDAAWATALAMSGLTPETLRESVIESKARDIVLTQEAESQGFVTDDDAIDAQVAQTRITVGADEDSAWLEMLQAYGYADEKAYRDTLVINDLQIQLYDAFYVEPTDEELKVFIAQNPTIVEGFNAGGEDAVPAADDAADGAETPDGVEEEAPVEAEVPMLDPEDVNLSDIPANVLTEYKELWSSNNKGLAFQEWIQELVDAADIVINEMPANVSYNVDMSLAGMDNDPYEEDDDYVPTFDSSSPEAVAAAVAQGLVITDEVVGSGDEATPGATVLVHYVGTLEDGTEFDSNVEGDTPFSFTLGSGGVIPGWDAGVVGMKVGGTRILVIPPDLAYGSADHGSIPGNSTLTFTVELVEVR